MGGVGRWHMGRGLVLILPDLHSNGSGVLCLLIQLSLPCKTCVSVCRPMYECSICVCVRTWSCQSLQLKCPILKCFGVPSPSCVPPFHGCAGPRAPWTSHTLPSAAKLVPVSARTPHVCAKPGPYGIYVCTYVHLIKYCTMCVIASCVHSVVGRKPPERVSRRQLAIFFDNLTGTTSVLCVLCLFRGTALDRYAHT